MRTNANNRSQLLLTALHNRVEFLDEAAAALGSLAGVTEFESKAGHRTEIGSRIAFVQVIEQGGADIVGGMDVDPGFRVG